MKQSSKPNVYVIAGPNGSGKTTFATTFLPEHTNCRHFVNADMIAQGIEPFLPEIAAAKAGRIVLDHLRELSDTKQHFAFETTLSGRTYINLLKKLKAKGYKLHIFYLWIPSAELAIARIKERVAQGGHHVPAKDVRRRFKRSIHNFFAEYILLADQWYLINNAVVPPQWVATGTGSNVTIMEKDVYETIKKF
jgi:predicted ABC-type ATPase